MRGRVIPFERSRGWRAPIASPAPRLDYQPLLDDVVLNTGWDRLVALAMQASCRRDSESLIALKACLERLRSLVERDWS